jgi:3-methyl-2-oxobutanoate hydroxymethyltransferase
MIGVASIRENGDRVWLSPIPFFEDLIDATGTALLPSLLPFTAMNRWSARIVARSNVDAILVGDSAAMVVHGHQTTHAATVAQMAAHTEAVARAAPDRFVIADLPFLSFRKGVATAMRAVGRLVVAGAQAVKLEGLEGHEDVVAHVVGSGVPVMGHIGLTPQSFHQLGGFRTQGRSDEDASRLLRQAEALERLGCFAVVLECMPAALACRITSALTVPTIGIGAGAGTDGQVLVLHDLLGLDTRHAPRFVRRYLDGERLVTDALNEFDQDVKSVRFPAPGESYS